MAKNCGAHGQGRLAPPFEKGKSGNPGGRPKGAEGFAQMLRAATGDGKKLRDWLIEIASDPESPDRMRAITMIADRAFGKVREEVVHSGGMTLEGLLVASVPGNSDETKKVT